MSAMSAEQVQRRYLVLTASRWLPTGFLIPLIVIAPLQRGLSLAQIGLIAAVSSIVVFALELPTGGLSDAVGRRPVLLAAAAFSLVSTGLLAFATTVAVFAVAYGAEGVYRALDSGPLDAWYVDAAQAADPDAEIERGLARRGATMSIAMAVGALSCGGLALLPELPGLPVLALPVLVSLALRVVDTVLVAALVREQRPDRRNSTWLGSAVRDAARTVREAVVLLRNSRALWALTATELLWGAGMTAPEVFVAPRLVELLSGDAERGVLTFAVASTVGWVLSGVGAGVAPWMANRVGGWVTTAVLTRAFQGVAIASAGFIAGPIGVLSAFLGFYLVHGGANVAHAGLLNRHVGSAHRATMLSVNSLAARAGIVVAAPLFGLLATGAGLPLVFVLAGVLLAAGAPLYLLAHAPTARVTA